MVAAVWLYNSGTKVEVIISISCWRHPGSRCQNLLRDATKPTWSQHIKYQSCMPHTGISWKMWRKQADLSVQADYAKIMCLRSGLMLTGASEASGTTQTLTAVNKWDHDFCEAMNLDLKGTDLVVLSPANRPGEIKAGEGVYGLQRAFLVAGAEAIIMSLWKVGRHTQPHNCWLNNFIMLTG